jgi:hypothetical protein
MLDYGKGRFPPGKKLHAPRTCPFYSFTTLKE